MVIQECIFGQTLFPVDDVLGKMRRNKVDIVDRKLRLDRSEINIFGFLTFVPFGLFSEFEINLQ